MRTVTIVAFGDSITEAAQQAIENRWPEIVRLALRRRFPGDAIELVNAGVGGNTTREGLLRMDRDVLRHHPDIVLVEFNNDVTPEMERHVSYDEYIANLDLMRMKMSQTCNAQMVLLVFPPIIDAWHTKAFPFLTGWGNGGQDAAVEHYRELVRKFAQTHHLPLVDLDRTLRAAMAEHDVEEYILPDGCHLTAGGNRLVAETALPVLAKELERLLANGEP